VVNAFALAGGQIVVYSGLLQKIETPEALAALLAHESAHVNERHSLRSLLRNAANAILLSVVFNDATGISAALVGNVNTLNGLRYSRSLETEADEEGMNLLLANKVDLNGMRALMQTLEKEGDAPDRLSFLSTHPLTKNRIKKAERYIQKHPQEVAQRADLKALFQTLK
jgi:predicted Zn-dependent protease